MLSAPLVEAVAEPRTVMPFSERAVPIHAELLARVFRRLEEFHLDGDERLGRSIEFR